MKGQPSGLIQVLLDNGAEFGDRHDAAMDLGSFDEVSVEEALARLACDKGTDDDLADACAESLAQIWCRKGDVTRDVMIRLTPVSLRVALATMRECSPLLAAKADSILRADDQMPERARALAHLAEQLTEVARHAGAEILKIYAADFTTQRKADQSPVTEADLAAEAVILAALRRLTPDIPVIAEEQAQAEGLPAEAARRFWLVDPLDGTKEFVARNGEFTVNIALVDAGMPVLGIVHLPALDETYRGHSGKAERSIKRAPFEPIAARTPPAEGAVMTISRSHAAKELVKAEEMGERIQGTIVAGSSLKFCRLAEGVADLYPRFGTTMEWDTAAGHAVLAAAGGTVSTLEGAPLGYGKSGFRNPHFIARGRRG